MLSAILAFSSALSAPVATGLHLAAHRQAIGRLAGVHADHITKFGAPTPGQRYHDGLYVDGCEDLSHGDEFRTDNRNFSVAATYLFDESNNFKIDYTIYINDNTCSPVASDVFLKQMVQGRITYSNVPGSTTKFGATYQVTQGDYVFSQEMTSQEMTELNQVCGRQCGVDWRHAGTLISIAAHDCKLSGVMPTDAPLLCRMVSGQKWYNGFQYSNGYFVQTAAANPGEVAHGQAAISGSFDQNAGWGEPLDNTNHVNWIQPSHNQDPNGCTLLYATCKAYVTSVGTTCDTCDRLKPTDPASKVYTNNFLECDGCAYRQAKAINKPQLFGNCCPCFYAYSKQNPTAVVPWFGHLNC